MVDSLSNALLLMLIGMITVFVILSIVVFFGGVLIKIINGLYKETVVIQDAIPHKHLAVITAVTQEVTKGQASEIKIDKL